MIKAVDPVVEPTAGEQSLAVRRPDQAAKTRRQRNPTDDLARASADRNNLVLTVASVQNRQDWLGRMHCNLYRQIPQPNLASRRPERPTIGKHNRACACHPGPNHLVTFARSVRPSAARLTALGRMVRRFGFGRSS